MFGPYHNFQPKKMNYYRCGNCDFNLRLIEEAKRCPKCRTPTAEMQAPESEILTEDETLALIKHWSFRRYLGNETDEDRDVRRSRAQQVAEDFQKRLERFPDVIQGAAFEDWERERIAALEARFPQLGV